ncbi:NSUN5 [Symbiodinium sp. CCMP2592]|nr:NSUN5 [Symbiodinium sp. CCMP2592]
MAKIYFEAGRVVDDVLSGRSGLKAALYAQQLSSDPRAVCKLSSCTLSNKAAIAEALEHVGLDHHSHGMMLVMAYELLLGHGLRGGGKLRRELEGHARELQAAFKKSSQHSEVLSEQKEAFSSLPRYVRVNRLQLAEDLEVLRRRLAKALRRAAGARSEQNKHMEATRVEVDAVVPNVLRLPAASRRWLRELPEVESGALVLQDRSSCLSALAAGLVPGSFVLDSCAAPGSKTAHAIELLQARGRLAAFERDPKRAAALLQRLQLLVGFTETPKRKAKGRHEPEAKSDFSVLKWGSQIRGRCWARAGAGAAATGAEGVEVAVHVGDFLDTNPARPPWNQVDVLIVDPSCSGSGLPEHHLIDATAETGTSRRVQRLAAFQKRILSHALSFPKAKTVVYSTCSTHRLENEDVVEEVLCRYPGFEVVEALPWWQNAPLKPATGKPFPSWAKNCLRSDPVTHKCRGFFLCRLDRLEHLAHGPGDADPPPEPSRRKRKRRLATSAPRPEEIQVASKDKDKAFLAAPKAKKGSGLRILRRLAKTLWA